MQRKICLVGAAVVAALGLAAFVHGQQSDEPTGELTLTDRLRDIRRQVIGDTGGGGEGQRRPNANFTPTDDWSAGRKFGVPGRTSQPPSGRNSSSQNAADQDNAAEKTPATGPATGPITGPATGGQRPAGSSWNNPLARPANANPSYQRNPFVGSRGLAGANPGNKAPAAATSRRAPANQPLRNSPQSAAAAVESSTPDTTEASTALHARLKALRSAQNSGNEETVVTPSLARLAPAEAPPSVSDVGPDRKPSETSEPSLSQANRPAELSGANSDASAPRVARRLTNSELNETPKTVLRSATGATDGALVASRSPVLQVKTTGPQKIVIGKSGSYQVVIENSGDVAANEVTLSIKLPAWAEVETAKPSAGKTDKSAAEQAGEALQWRLSRLEARSQETLSLAIVPRQSKPFQLAVEWTFVPEAFQALVDVLEPKLALAMAAPDEMLFGQAETVKVTLTNPGTGNAENVILAIASNQPGQDVPERRPVGTLAAGESKVIELRLPGLHAGTVSLGATATADGGLSAESSARILVRRAGLKIEAIAPRAKYAGTPTTCKLKVSNPGNAPAVSVRVEAVLPAGAKFLSASGGGKAGEDQAKVTWTISALDAGAEQVLDVRCSLATAGENRLHVLATAEGKLSDSTTATTRVEALADLKVELTDPQGPTPINEDIVYEVRIRNRGTKAAEKVTVVGYFTEGLEPTKVAGAVATLEPGQVSCQPIAALAAGDETTIKITARASAAGNHVFRAEITCQHPETRLVAEETTTFYGEGTVDGPEASPIEAASGVKGESRASSTGQTSGEISVKKSPSSAPAKSGSAKGESKKSVADKPSAASEPAAIRVESPKRVSRYDE